MPMAVMGSPDKRVGMGKRIVSPNRRCLGNRLEGTTVTRIYKFD
jgi:hypothetical protein